MCGGEDVANGGEEEEGAEGREGGGGVEVGGEVGFGVCKCDVASAGLRVGLQGVEGGRDGGVAVAEGCCYY